MVETDGGDEGTHTLFSSGYADQTTAVAWKGRGFSVECATGKGSSGFALQAAIWKSEDGGNEWLVSFVPPPPVTLFWIAVNGDTVLAAGYPGEAKRRAISRTQGMVFGSGA